MTDNNTTTSAEARKPASGLRGPAHGRNLPQFAAIQPDDLNDHSANYFSNIVDPDPSVSSSI